MMKNRKAVSEIVGYILVLMAIVATITVIYSAGMPAIKSKQDLAVFKSVENTFYILQNVERLVAYNVTPTKSIGVRIEDGSFAVVPDWGYIRISVRYTPGHGLGVVEVFNFSKRYGAVVYVKGDKAIILDNGAMIECHRSRCFVVSEPRFLKTADGYLNLYFSLINVSGSVSFTGKRNVVFKNVGSTILPTFSNNTTPPRNVTIQIKIEKAEEFGLNSTAIERTLLQYINETLFDGEAVFIDSNTIRAEIQKSGNPPKRLIYDGLNITVGYHNVLIR
jgi:hypothetical protein